MGKRYEGKGDFPGPYILPLYISDWTVQTWGCFIWIERVSNGGSFSRFSELRVMNITHPPSLQVPNGSTHRMSSFFHHNSDSPNHIPFPPIHPSKMPFSFHLSQSNPTPTFPLASPLISLTSNNSYSLPNAKKCAKRELKCGSLRRCNMAG